MRHVDKIVRTQNNQIAENFLLQNWKKRVVNKSDLDASLTRKNKRH